MSYLFRLQPSKPAASLSFIDSCPRYGGRMVKLQEAVGADARRSGREVDPSRDSYRPGGAETSFLNVKRTLQAAAVKRPISIIFSEIQKFTSGTEEDYSFREYKNKIFKV